MWGIMAILGILSFLATRNLDRLPSGIQNLMETVVEMLFNFFGDILGEKRARQMFPFLGTMFLFILMSNYSGLIPGAGHVNGLAAPSSTWSVTAGLALCVFFATHYFGVKADGLKYFKSFTKPVFLMLPLNLVEQCVRPLSLSLRLYGNIFGEEMTLAVLLGLVPYFVPIAMMGLSLLLGGIQAVVFTLLSSIYFLEAVHH
jgi:F-type H+-transporting ATPase subunit a